MSCHYHLCFVVQDIEAATREMTATLGVAWSPVRDGRLGDWDYRIVFSVDGPPFLELVEGPPGSPWDSSGGSHFDHLGYWAENIGVASRPDAVSRGQPHWFVTWQSIRSGHLARRRRGVPRDPDRLLAAIDRGVLDTSQTFRRDRLRIRDRSTQPIHPPEG
jgi:hypothetical protein